MAAVEADERPLGGQLVGLERPAGMIADHERRPVLAQQRVDVLDEPAGVAELETVAAGRDARERVGEPLVVAMKALRQLPEDRTELGRVDERLDSLVEALESLAEVGQALDVRQEPARLHREDEVRRSLLDPAANRVPLRE